MFQLPVTEALDYVPLHIEILACCGLPASGAAASFHCWSYQCEQDLRAQVNDFLRVTPHRLQPDQQRCRPVAGDQPFPVGITSKGAVHNGDGNPIEPLRAG